MGISVSCGEAIYVEIIHIVHYGNMYILERGGKNIVKVTVIRTEMGFKNLPCFFLFPDCTSKALCHHQIWRCLE